MVAVDNSVYSTSRPEGYDQFFIDKLYLSIFIWMKHFAFFQFQESRLSDRALFLNLERT